MKRVLISICFAWFLVIQSIGIDGRTVAVLPVQDETWCNKVIEQIKGKTYVYVHYTCVDVGNINS